MKIAQLNIFKESQMYVAHNEITDILLILGNSLDRKSVV